MTKLLQSNIAGDIIVMNSKKLEKLRARIEKLRKKPCNISSRELENIARSLGRELNSRGKEPTWVSTLLPKSRPISIPNRATLKKFTAGNIMDQLENDISELEAEIEFTGE